MTQGTTGTYAVNGTDFLMQPTTGRWLPRPLVGITGDGHPVYPQTREYELRWTLDTPADFDQMRLWFESCFITGTLVIDLPQWDSSTYTFRSYTGCVLYEPEQNVYFAEHHTDVVMIVGSVVT